MLSSEKIPEKGGGGCPKKISIIEKAKRDVRGGWGMGNGETSGQHRSAPLNREERGYSLFITLVPKGL